MLAEDEPAFEKYFRMSKEKFFELVRRLEPNITKQDTRMRESIKPEERVAVTLRYLATGETFSSLETQFRIHRTTISEIVLVVCENVFEVLGKEVLNLPSSTAEWLSLSEKFESRWNFPNGLFAGSSRERRQKKLTRRHTLPAKKYSIGIFPNHILEDIPQSCRPQKHTSRHERRPNWKTSSPSELKTRENMGWTNLAPDSLLDARGEFWSSLWHKLTATCYTDQCCCKFLNRFQKLATCCSTANIAKNCPQRGVTLEQFFAQHRIIASWRCKLTSVTPPLDEIKFSYVTSRNVEMH